MPDLPKGGGHWTRTIAFGPDGKLYVSVGSSCNVCEETDQRRAAILQFNPDGTGGRIFARGIRNAVGIAFHPQTGDLWATNNGRDWLGDEFPPETILIVKDGAHHGWPYCNGARIPDPTSGDPFLPDHGQPALEIQAHSAPLGLTFYAGEAFPQAYRGSVFAALHGSWNRSVPTGYKVIHIPVRDGKPGPPEDFATGWLRAGGAWGAPSTSSPARTVRSTCRTTAPERFTRSFIRAVDAHPVRHALARSACRSHGRRSGDRRNLRLFRGGCHADSPGGGRQESRQLHP